MPSVSPGPAGLSSGNVIHYVFLCRVPLIMGVGLFFVPILAATSMSEVLRGVFTLEGFWDLSLVFGLILFSTWSVWLHFRVIYIFGLHRYKLKDFPTLPGYKFYWLVSPLIGCLLAAPGLLMVFANSESELGKTLWSLLGGFMWAAIAIEIPFVIRASMGGKLIPWDWLVKGGVDEAGSKDGQEGKDVKTGDEPPAGRVNQESANPTPVLMKSLRLPPRLLGFLGDGYVDNQKSTLLPGHLVLAGTFGMFLFYFVIFGLVLFRPGATLETQMQPLFYLLILLNIAGYSLSALTFFLDMYRVPLVALVIVLPALVYQFASVDHYFRVEPRERDWVSVAEAIAERARQIPATNSRKKTAVVVAASGGGIQAAAWTTQVLSGLADHYGDPFVRSVLLISAVSGGSVGTMHYLHAVGRTADELAGETRDQATRDEIAAAHRGRAVEAASKSGLESTGWGVLFPDLARLSLVWFIVPQYVDRGWALERAWDKALAAHEAQPEQTWTQKLLHWVKRINVDSPPAPTFGDWERQIRRGMLPIPIFNATIVETGERLLLSPVKVAAAPDGSANKGRDFHSLYPDADVSVVTAARLSATFPYITPVARAGELPVKEGDRKASPAGMPQYHIADGGYYDNYGMMTLVEWLDRYVLGRWAALGIDTVLVVQIQLAESAEPGAEVSSGWESAFLGPLMTLFNVRQSTQRSRNDLELNLLKRAWEVPRKGEKATGESAPRIESATFRFSGRPVLSWKLTNKEKQAIADYWRTPVSAGGPDFQTVERFFARAAQPSVDRRDDGRTLPEGR